MPSMLEAIYKAHESMTIANGYNYDWQTLRSIGNGSLAVKALNSPCMSVQFGDDTSSPEAGQSLYHMSNVIRIIGQIEYDTTVDLEEQDVEVWEDVRKMKQDIAQAFGFVSPSMFASGIRLIAFAGEVEREAFSGHVVSCEMQFEIKWYEQRKRVL